MGDDVQKLNQVAQQAAIDAAKKKAAAAEAEAKQAEDEAKPAEQSDEEERNEQGLTRIQNEVTNALVKKKWRINRIKRGNPNEGEKTTVYLMKNPVHYSTLYAEVDEAGNVNGKSLEEFLSYSEGSEEETSEACTGKSDCPCPACVKRRHDYIMDHGGYEDAEEKKMKKIKPHPLTCNKPDCPKCTLEGRRKDEERLRKSGYYGAPNNESADITNFIKAISQKNYAVANKYLQGVVESKLKRSINKANNK
jgi:hypothetical protein